MQLSTVLWKLSCGRRSFLMFISCKVHLELMCFLEGRAQAAAPATRMLRMLLGWVVLVEPVGLLAMGCHLLIKEGTNETLECLRLGPVGQVCWKKTKT